MATPVRRLLMVAFLPVAIEGWHIRFQITRVITSPFIN
jgi:hypothetical protein